MQCSINIRRLGDNDCNLTRPIRAYRCSIRTDDKRASPCRVARGKRLTILLYMSPRWTFCLRRFLRFSLQSRGLKGSWTIGRSSVSLIKRISNVSRIFSLSSREEVRIRRDCPLPRKEPPSRKRDVWKIAESRRVRFLHLQKCLFETRQIRRSRGRKKPQRDLSRLFSHSETSREEMGLFRNALSRF